MPMPVTLKPPGRRTTPKASPPSQKGVLREGADHTFGLASGPHPTPRLQLKAPPIFLSHLPLARSLKLMEGVAVGPGSAVSGAALADGVK